MTEHNPFYCPVGQGFGENFNNSYKGILGHPGVDEACGYGTDIKSYMSGDVIGLKQPDPENPNRFPYIQMLCKTDVEDFEFIVGHVSEINVALDVRVEEGDIIGKEGNFGKVFSGNVLVSEERKKSGDKSGSHRHSQKRPLYKVSSTKPYKRYVQTPQGLYRDEEGFYYEYVFPYNRYAGCVNWLQPLFRNRLTIGSRGYEVHLLQRAMKAENLAADWNPTGFFGPLTLNAVRKFQSRFGYTPALGVGPKTRTILNSKYSFKVEHKLVFNT